MGKRKLKNTKYRKHHDSTHAKHAPKKPFSAKHPQPPPKAAPKPEKSAKQQAPTKSPQHSRPEIPFDPHDRILLVGEGDFSFSLSLLTHHGCADLTATCLDSAEELLRKYTQAAGHIEELEAEGMSVLYGVDATKLGKRRELRGKEWDRVVFNFPHVGGKSRDVNRQVRYNQELLVAFFRAALPLLAPDGTIIVTLFEGEPYTLWNIRDLARHVGLKVGRSFKFSAEAYPGYRHARTLGNIEGDGGWKGEDRPARTYVFEKAEEGERAKEPKSKRRRDEETDEDSEDG
ncbi:hypothetical protein W97_05164 [Coniosporium apollinis CBS 100218]|uniref:25S rRNA (uridine-N(3))-methyltransferase BMT5-like domain-containing protein n=1 Tax=Coniosporium apollinis (strain CBS 100218) TaxID=1168221 RepID=R7YVJ2_CONA1|nr:uncharacterized protein W97_05164 [Coniosporium apollinis CBS 100218]EON65922.1 hypothetical protein W97_05164 [Coniosporium apollinis CBS 100218]